MRKNQFNDEWIYSRTGESAFHEITLPHDAMIAEKRSAESLGGTNTGWFAGYDYIYRKTFQVPEEWTGKRVILEFEGIYHRAEVWFNGKQMAFHPYGYTGFRVDITENLLVDKENILEIIARNTEQPNSRWYSGAGIYRPVWIYVLPETHIEPDGIKIKTLDCEMRKIQIEIQASGSGEAEVEIWDKEKIIKADSVEINRTGTMEISLPGTRLWDLENPYMYTCRVKLGKDIDDVAFGIRTVECSAEKGFCLNGKRVILRGACIHHDNGFLGAVANPFAERRKIRLLKKAGYNAIRSAHNPCSKAMLDACDQLGMLVIDEYADMWYIHKTQYDYAEYLPEWWKQDIQAIIDKDYNHPSVIMYSIGNEVSETAQKKGIELAEQMMEYIYSKDMRPVTCGINIFFNFLSSMGFGVYSDKKAKADLKKAEKQSSGKTKHKAVGSEFFNNLAGLLGADFMKFGATLHGSDIKTRDAFAKLDVAGYNYGIKRYKKDLKKYPNRIILGSETFCSDAYHFWELAKNHEALIGDFVWAGIDYLGEVGLGAWEYSDYAPDFSHGPGWLTAGVGCLDITGKETCEATYMQVAYELAPVRMGVVPVNHTNDKHSPSAWRATNAIESWSWEGYEGKMARVEVYARGEKTALFLNNKKVGERLLKKDCKVIFQIDYKPGTLTAVTYDKNGEEQGRTSLVSAGEETHLKLEPEQETVREDELCYIRLRYTDAEGNLKPLANGNIKVSVQGGKLLGLGNACPYQKKGYFSNDTDTYFGEALAIVQPGEGEHIVLEAESPFGNNKVTIVKI